MPALVVDNQTISCVSPPSDTGTLVPLTVTLNRQVTLNPKPFTINPSPYTPNPKS